MSLPEGVVVKVPDVTRFYLPSAHFRTCLFFTFLFPLYLSSSSAVYASSLGLTVP